MKKLAVLFCLLTGTLSYSQGGYDIKINIKGLKDTMVFLAKYNFDKQYIVDTCKKVKNGNIVFKGKKDLDKGVYFLVSQEKIRYFDFFVNENTKLTISSDMADMVNGLKAPGSKENEDFFGYIQFITNKNIEFGKAKDQSKSLAKPDSIKFMTEKMKALNEAVLKFDTDYLKAHKGKLLGDVLNLKTDKELKDVPKG
ncbi:MAG: DUF4369 domain-containing protein [Sphingobacteriaceae bacterium]|nr:DUF4369 domain-containing protein [Sphingobacteriaceae bacterium]